MNAEKQPALMFYCKDYVSDPKVRRLNYEQRGIYIELLCAMWISGKDELDDDDGDIARILGVQKRRWLNAKACIQKDGNEVFLAEDGKLKSERLAHERQKHEDFRAKRSAAGKKGAAAKHAKPLPQANGVAKDDSSHAPASATPIAKEEEPPRPPATRAARVRDIVLTDDQRKMYAGYRAALLSHLPDDPIPAVPTNKESKLLRSFTSAHSMLDADEFVAVAGYLFSMRDYRPDSKISTLALFCKHWDELRRKKGLNEEVGKKVAVVKWSCSHCGYAENDSDDHCWNCGKLKEEVCNGLQQA